MCSATVVAKRGKVRVAVDEDSIILPHVSAISDSCLVVCDRVSRKTQCVLELSRPNHSTCPSIVREVTKAAKDPFSCSVLHSSEIQTHLAAGDRPNQNVVANLPTQLCGEHWLVKLSRRQRRKGL